MRSHSSGSPGYQELVTGGRNEAQDRLIPSDGGKREEEEELGAFIGGGANQPTNQPTELS